MKYNLSSALGVSAVSRIQVNSSGNTVTLQGSVPNSEARAEAERVALGTQGVTKVINQLSVQP
ncbi:MAG: BON domain-containing protein [Bryobacteraceae bacterium]